MRQVRQPARNDALAARRVWELLVLNLFQYLLFGVHSLALIKNIYIYKHAACPWELPKQGTGEPPTTPVDFKQSAHLL